MSNWAHLLQRRMNLLGLIPVMTRSELNGSDVQADEGEETDKEGGCSRGLKGITSTVSVHYRGDNGPDIGKPWSVCIYYARC